MRSHTMTAALTRLFPLLLIFALAVLPGCVTNPITGQREFAPFMPSREQQINLGLKAAPEFEAQSGGRLNNAAVQNYVDQVGARLLAAMPAELRQDYKFDFTVLASDDINAFALPGGPVYITSGILKALSNEGELAFILGHEIGHVIAEHAARQMSQQQEMSLLLAAASSAVGDSPSTAQQIGLTLGQFAGQMSLLKYGRDEERESDQAGLQFMVNANYDPQAAVTAMQVLQRMGGSGADFFSTHPNPGNRIQLLNGMIQQNFPQARNNPRYQLNREGYQRNVLGQLK